MTYQARHDLALSSRPAPITPPVRSRLPITSSHILGSVADDDGSLLINLGNVTRDQPAIVELVGGIRLKVLLASRRHHPITPKHSMYEYGIFVIRLGWCQGGPWGGSPMAVPDGSCLGHTMFHPFPTQPLSISSLKASNYSPLRPRLNSPTTEAKEPQSS